MRGKKVPNNLSEYQEIKFTSNNEKESRDTLRKAVVFLLVSIGFILLTVLIYISIEKLYVILVGIVFVLVFAITSLYYSMKFTKLLITSVFEGEYNDTKIQLINKTNTCIMYINEKEADIYSGLAALSFQLKGTDDRNEYVISVTAYTVMKARLFVKPKSSIQY